MKEKVIKTTKRYELISLDNELLSFISEEKIDSGVVYVFCPHTTASIIINENADPDVLKDLILAAKTHFPYLSGFKHLEGNSDAHFLASVFGCEKVILVENKKPIFGIWQSLYFFEFDGPRSRKIYFKKG